MIDGAVSARTVHEWLGARYPKLADECDRIQGLVNLFGDIVEGISAHAESLGRDPADMRATAYVGAGTASIRIDLGVS
jgi:hypothetical protein